MADVAVACCDASMGNVGARLADLGFGRPRGPLGRIGGRLMARGNAATERHLVQLAELGPGDEVLVLGPGPGIGLHVAAQHAKRAVGGDPSELMLDACRRRCAYLIKDGKV